MPLNVDVMVFDSGIGGLSILQAVRRQAPGLSYCFVGDNAGLPYGNKSDDWLLERLPKVIDQALQEVSCQLLIVACNTASTIVLPPLRAKYQFPVIGVVPAIKPAAARSRKKIIGLLATPATIARPYTNALIEEFAPECTVIKVGSSRLVVIAEEKLRGQAPDPCELKIILEPFISQSPDLVVLGCTHFPLLRQEFADILPGVEWMDSGEAIAKRVLHFGLPASRDTSTADGIAYFTLNNITLAPLQAFGLNSLRFLTV